jgi:uncharacterized damage-inducible protein DinB
MSETKRIRDQFRRMVHGPAWHGPSLDESLDGLTHEHAAARPVAGAHTIHELVHHVGAWIGEGVKRCGGRGPRLPDEGDFPPATRIVDAAEWTRVRAHVAASCEELLAVLDVLDEHRLGERVGEDLDPATGAGVTIYGTLHGVVQHTAYHAGQIMILRKALGL